MPDQRVDVTVVQGTGAYAAADRQSDQQDRIAEGTPTGACSDTRRQIQELLGQRAGLDDLCIWHRFIWRG